MKNTALRWKHARVEHCQQPRADPSPVKPQMRLPALEQGTTENWSLWTKARGKHGHMGSF